MYSTNVPAVVGVVVGTTTETTNANHRDGPTTINNLRYDRLFDLIDKTLSKSRSDVDIKKAIQDCYGNDDDNENQINQAHDKKTNDNDVVVSHNNNNNTTNQVFQTMLERGLEKAHRSITNDMTRYIKEHTVYEQLLRFESVIKKLDHDIELHKQKELNDKESALLACKRIKLNKKTNNTDDNSNNITTKSLEEYNNIMQNYVYTMAYDKMKLEQMELYNEMNTLQKEIHTLNIQSEEIKNISQNKLNHIHELKINIEKSANICSMISS